MDLPTIRSRGRHQNNRQTGTSRLRTITPPQQTFPRSHNRWQQQAMLPGSLLGNDRIVIGTTSDEMGGGEYYEYIHKLSSGQVPRVNLKKEKTLLRSMLRTLRSGRVESVHDVSKGGLAVALAEMSVQGRKGVTVDLDEVPNKTSRMDNLLFSESRSRFVLETKPRNTASIVHSFRRLGIRAAKVGSVTDNGVEFLSKEQSIITIPLAEASRAWSETIPRAMEATL